MCKYLKNTHYVQIFRGIAQNSVGTVRFQKTSTQKKIGWHYGILYRKS